MKTNTRKGVRKFQPPTHNTGTTVMRIDIKKMEAQGFDVNVNEESITITPMDGIRLDWMPIHKQLNNTNLTVIPTNDVRQIKRSSSN